MENSLITVGTFQSLIDAHFALTKLEHEGIEAVVFDENIGGMLNVTVGGIKLKTRKEDAERAKEILSVR